LATTTPVEDVLTRLRMQAICEMRKMIPWDHTEDIFEWICAVHFPLHRRSATGDSSRDGEEIGAMMFRN